jgi:prevent-host-death family protein
MERIGIRELRQDASSYVDRATQGERFVITNRGREVAELGPLNDDALAALEGRGELRRASRDLADLEPPRARRGRPSTSAALDELRGE